MVKPVASMAKTRSIWLPWVAFIELLIVVCPAGCERRYWLEVPLGWRVFQLTLALRDVPPLGDFLFWWGARRAL